MAVAASDDVTVVNQMAFSGAMDGPTHLPRGGRHSWASELAHAGRVKHRPLFITEPWGRAFTLSETSDVMSGRVGLDEEKKGACKAEECVPRM